MQNTYALILAAGKSSRMGIDKAVLQFPDNKTLLTHQVELLKNSGIEDIFVVIGCNALKIKHHHENLKVNWAENKEWQKGQFSSVQKGLQSILEKDNNAKVLLMPIDVIGLEVSLIKEIIKKGKDENKTVVPVFNKKQGHPVYLSNNFIKILTKEPIDSKLNILLEKKTDLLMLEVSTSTILTNINTKEEWNKVILIMSCSCQYVS